MRPGEPASSAHARTASRAVFGALAALVLFGALRADDVLKFVAYLMVLASAAAPMLIWLRAGAGGVPVLPVVALAHVPYYALPIVSRNEAVAQYSNGEVMWSALVVGLYLLAATLAWGLLAFRRTSRTAFELPPDHLGNVMRLIFVSLFMGVLFHIGTSIGLWLWLGSFYGVLRSLVVTLCIVACFLIGLSRAQGALKGTTFAAAMAGVTAIILLAWSSLFLVGGILYALAVVLGYVLVARRIPWTAAVVLIAVAAVLHSGKGEMRQRYWLEDTNYGAGVSVTRLPGFMLEWFGEGLKAISAGEVETNALQRTSLLQMVLMVQSVTPESIDYLNGETYALLPPILVPRFIDASKPASQIGMDLLNVRYGLLSSDEASVTAIGWGLIAEAYANFGAWADVAIGGLFGLFCGLVALWSAGKPVISVPVLFGIAAMMTLVNVELDFIQVVSVLTQVLAAVILFFLLYGWLVIRQERSTPRLAVRS